MATSITQQSDASTVAETIQSMRTGVLVHPENAQDGRFLVLPHPRTAVPTYYLHSDVTTGSGSSASWNGELFELSSLKDGKYDRCWMVSNLNQVISSGQLEILSRIDVRFVVISLLHSALGDGKFRSLEDTFEQIALVLYGRRKEDMVESIPALKAKLSEGGASEGEEDGVQQDWSDIITFGKLPLVKKALEEVADVQDLPNGEQAYRLSTAKTFSILDNKHQHLSSKFTFVASPNMLGRNFERRWQSDSDPSPYLTTSTEEEQESDCKDAKDLRAKIAAEIIATNLPPQLAREYFEHLHIQVDN
ncbi:uncharacterized protein UTRI_00712 [Ustilago trichophora]|uniref:Ribonuclease H2 subunit B n=1 Tax=Ustilago trichophora TaxID=86804 RepID=A0A5C3DS82_9BASI|nr:uncharacterized protein UTRI_00712 [Ustilago trichophora]